MLDVGALALAGLLVASSSVLDRLQGKPAVLPVSGSCGSSDAASRDRFELFGLSRPFTLQEALDDHAARGYRLLVLSGYLLFEKVEANTRAPEYRVLKSGDSAAFERELNEAASRGFRLIPTTVVDAGSYSAFLIQAIMEKAPPKRLSVEQQAPPPQHEYQIVRKQGGSTEQFERSIGDAASTGYRPVAIERFYRYDAEGDVVGEPELVAVLERISGDDDVAAAPVVTGDRYKLLITKHSQVQTHLIANAAKGYRLLVVQAESILLFERSPHLSRPEYVVVRPTGFSLTNPSTALRRDMNRAASRGFRLRPGSLIFSRTRGPFWNPSVGAIMEKPGQPGPEPEYLVIDTFRTSTLRKELAAGLAKGFTPVDMLWTPAAHYMFLQKPRWSCDHPPR
jgi:hypothetical protein